MRLSFAAMIVLALGSAGCGRACDKTMGRSIANATEDDLREIVAALGIKEKISCDTPHAIRRSRCLVHFSPDEHATLVKRLELTEKPIEKGYDDPTVTCTSWREGRTIKRNVRMEPLPNVGAQLKQPYRGFDVYWDEKTGDSCIEVQIAYG